MISHLNGNFLSNRRAKNRFADIFADHKCADRANVHDTELRQLFRDQRRPTSISAADVHRTKKYDPTHPKKYY